MHLLLAVEVAWPWCTTWMAMTNQSVKFYRSLWHRSLWNSLYASLLIRIFFRNLIRFKAREFWGSTNVSFPNFTWFLLKKFSNFCLMKTDVVPGSVMKRGWILWAEELTKPALFQVCAFTALSLALPLRVSVSCWVRNNVCYACFRAVCASQWASTCKAGLLPPNKLTNVSSSCLFNLKGANFLLFPLRGDRFHQPCGYWILSGSPTSSPSNLIGID